MRGGTAVAVALAVLGAAEAHAQDTSVAVAVDGIGRAERVPDMGVPPDDRRAAPAGASTPLSVFTDPQGRTCQVYARTVSIEGQSETAYATLCRQANGRWVLVR
jgi:surface antigen